MKDKGTGEILHDLPSPYKPHACGLLHLPRFLAKIKKHLAGKLPQSYQRNFTKGFDGFLCLHLGIESEAIIAVVENTEDEASLDKKLMALFPEDLKVHEWNRKVVQMGMSEMGRESLEQTKQKMGIEDRVDLVSFADMIDYDEERLT